MMVFHVLSILPLVHSSLQSLSERAAGACAECRTGFRRVFDSTCDDM